jgi:DNA repair exonuclease SbcCD ATPase subunit
MKPARLYIENFMCYDRAYIDFTQFSVALVVGKIEGNDSYSNGVGKTSIFKAIEYVLFNQADVNLENIVRDDASACRIVLDFTIGDQEYRISRSRTKKGSSDLTLLQRNTTAGSEEEVYHSISGDEYNPYLDKKETKKYWKDLSGSRASDTEKDLFKLVKFNRKSFRSTIHFPQKDMEGLPTATPEKRKSILKEALNLGIYSKLEKIAKDKSNALAKDIEKTQILLEALGDPQVEIVALSSQLEESEKVIVERQSQLDELSLEMNGYKNKINDLTTLHSNLESKFESLLSREKTINSEKSRVEISVKEYLSKKSNVIKAAQELIEEIKDLKKIQVKLVAIDFSQIEILGEKVATLKEQVTCHNVEIKNNMEAYEDLKVPLPSGSVCKNCRKPMTDKDRKDHKLHIAQEMEACQNNIKKAKKSIVDLNAEILTHQQTINSLSLSKNQLEGLNTKITAKSKEITDKKALHEEYTNLHAKFVGELAEKNLELEQIAEELKNSSLEEAKTIQLQITAENQKVNVLTAKINALLKELTHFNNSKAVISHSIEQKKKDQDKKQELSNKKINLNEVFAAYPSVLQAFSTTGIPNLIIQTVLDDLQVESNNLLAQLKPGLQLSFFVEKTVEKTGDQADTLDIKYTINGKERYYEQLSGAMQLAVAFSLKLGLSFLLQKMIGTDIKFLLLDEIDQSLDKASVDAFADIVKFFQKEYTILVITHNDRLKDKFSHAILVEQDLNMVSRAKVVSSW